MRRLSLLLYGPALPLQRRLTLLTAMAVTVTLVVTGLTCLTGWIALRVTLWDISERASLLVARDLVPLAHDDLATTGKLSARVLGPGSTVVEAVRSDGTILLVPGEDATIPLGAAEAEAARQQATTVRNVDALDGHGYRIVTVPFGEPGYVLVVGRPLTSSNEVLHVFGLVVLVVGAVGVFWAGVLGRTVAKAALRPVRGFTEAVQHVSETEDLQPISTEPEMGGDLATLAQTFNQMLRQLATSRDQQNRLVADASHELRTPLTSMRTNVDLLVLDAGSGLLGHAGRAVILGDVQRQMIGLTTLIADLLQLTHDKAAIKHEPVDLRAVVETVTGLAHQRRPDLAFDVETDALDVVGDHDDLARAVTNLIDNAVTWSPADGTIHVRLDGHGLRVGDEGPGIADADLPHVFERFYRAEAARSTPGSGLGLAIAAKAVHDHGGTIEAGRSPQGGAQLTIKLPLFVAPELVALG